VLGECCNMCSKSDSVKILNCEKEMIAIVQTVKEAPSLGEKKVGIIHIHVHSYLYIQMSSF